MKNGDACYVSNSGRIRRKIRDSIDHVDIVCYKDPAQRYNSNREHYGSHLSYDGARPKQTQHYSQSRTRSNIDYVKIRDITPVVVVVDPHLHACLEVSFHILK